MPTLAAPRVVNVDDLRTLAKRRLPKAVFDYLDGGAEAEVTLRENSRVFDDVTFRPRQAVAVATCDLTTSVIGTTVDMPILLAPLGSSRTFYPRGEEVAARQAGEAGLIYVLSTLSGCTLEDVKAATSRAPWYQLYLTGGIDAARRGIDRARAAGFSALVVTIDTPIGGMRERDVRNGTKELLGRGMSMLRYVPQFLARPRWIFDFLRDGGLMNFPNVVLSDGSPLPYADVSAALQRTLVTWKDFEWIRTAWNGPIVVKGILTGEDARSAVNAGATAVVVSNHGGRQLDGVSPTLRALPEVVAAVNGRAEVLFDGGVRRGSDVAKALSLGARAVLVGRAYGYGLGAAGGAGVARAIEILRSDLTRTLKLLGCAASAELDRSYVDVPPGWTTRRPG